MISDSNTAAELHRDRTEAKREQFMDEAEAKRPALIETWIQESPLLYEVIGDELLHDVEFINAIRVICNAYATRGTVLNWQRDAGSRTIARLVRQQVDRTRGDDLVSEMADRLDEAGEKT